MSTLEEIGATLKVIELKKDDVCVIEIEQRLHPSVIARIREEWARLIRSNTRPILLDGGAHLAAVLRQTEPDYEEGSGI
jgi:hypothetical protein